MLFQTGQWHEIFFYEKRKHIIIGDYEIFFYEKRKHIIIGDYLSLKRAASVVLPYFTTGEYASLWMYSIKHTINAMTLMKKGLLLSNKEKTRRERKTKTYKNAEEILAAAWECEKVMRNARQTHRLVGPPPVPKRLRWGLWNMCIVENTPSSQYRDARKTAEIDAALAYNKVAKEDTNRFIRNAAKIQPLLVMAPTMKQYDGKSEKQYLLVFRGRITPPQFLDPLQYTSWWNLYKHVAEMYSDSQYFNKKADIAIACMSIIRCKYPQQMIEHPTYLMAFPEISQKKTAEALKAAGKYSTLGPGIDSHFRKCYGPIVDAVAPHATKTDKLLKVCRHIPKDVGMDANNDIAEVGQQLEGGGDEGQLWARRWLECFVGLDSKNMRVACEWISSYRMQIDFIRVRLNLSGEGILNDDIVDLAALAERMRVCRVRDLEKIVGLLDRYEAIYHNGYITRSEGGWCRSVELIDVPTFVLKACIRDKESWVEEMRADIDHYDFIRCGAITRRTAR